MEKGMALEKNNITLRRVKAVPFTRRSGLQTTALIKRKLHEVFYLSDHFWLLIISLPVLSARGKRLYLPYGQISTGKYAPYASAPSSGPPAASSFRNYQK